MGLTLRDPASFSLSFSFSLINPYAPNKKFMVKNWHHFRLHQPSQPDLFCRCRHVLMFMTLSYEQLGDTGLGVVGHHG